MMRFRRRTPARATSRNLTYLRRTEPAESTPLDPAALTLAVWLGLIALAGGITHLAANPAVQAAFIVPVTTEARPAAVPTSLDYRDFASGG